MTSYYDEAEEARMGWGEENVGEDEERTDSTRNTQDNTDESKREKHEGYDT